MLETSVLLTDENKEAIAEKLETNIMRAKLDVYGDENMTFEELKKLANHGIYRSPLLNTMLTLSQRKKITKRISQES